MDGTELTGVAEVLMALVAVPKDRLARLKRGRLNELRLGRGNLRWRLGRFAG